MVDGGGKKLRLWWELLVGAMELWPPWLTRTSVTCPQMVLLEFSIMSRELTCPPN